MFKLAGAAIGYFSLSGVMAIDGMAPSVGGPIPVGICGRLEDQLTTGDFPVDSNPNRYFVKYSRYTKDQFNAYVKCAPFDQIHANDHEAFDKSWDREDLKARKRYAAMFTRRDRFGYYTCDRVNGVNDGWVVKNPNDENAAANAWAIKDCPAVEGGKWDEFFPENAQVRIPQTQTEFENPYLGVHSECPSDNHYYFEGAWVASPCADDTYAVMSDDSCMKMSEEGAFADITVLGNGLKQVSWTDMNNELGVKGIPCGFNADIIELELDGKLRTMEFSNENSTLTWMPPMLDDLQYLREFHFNDQSQFENFEPTFFNKLGRPKKMESISITGVNADLDFQWPSTFFGMPESDGFGQFVSLDISDNSAFTKFKEEWLYQFVSMQGLYLSDNPALSDIPANLITRWDASLENFDISGNAIAEWPTNEEGDAVAFLDMENSMHIDISDNEFTSVPGSVFEDIQSINDGAGWSVDMGGNPCTPVDNPCTDVNTCACN